MALKIRRALLSVSDKTGVVELAQALHRAGAEIVATGKTAVEISRAGVPVVPIEQVTGTPEAFQGRMKTLSFQVCSGILFRRGSEADLEDARRLGILPIDCVVVNFYPFEKTKQIEEVDIGGPTLVRAAAKNAPDVLVLTDPSEYGAVIHAVESEGCVPEALCHQAAARTWDRVLRYDEAIAAELGAKGASEGTLNLRYGENPHQKAYLQCDANSPVEWSRPLTAVELSYNNLLDGAAAYSLLNELVQWRSGEQAVVIVKHGNPCGVAMGRGLQIDQLRAAWAGDPVSAFGGVVALSHPLSEETVEFLSGQFIELLIAPGLSVDDPQLKKLCERRKKLKAVKICNFDARSGSAMDRVSIPGGVLYQTPDQGVDAEFRPVTGAPAWTPAYRELAQFGVCCVRALKSNAIAIVRFQTESGQFQLVGAGQGQPNRIEALEWLALPRARRVLEAEAASSVAVLEKLAACVMVSDAFFPFRDTVDAAARAGLRRIVQPGGSLRDEESIQAAREQGVAMAFTGTRHFKH